MFYSRWSWTTSDHTLIALACKEEKYGYRDCLRELLRSAHLELLPVNIDVFQAVQAIGRLDWGSKLNESIVAWRVTAEGQYFLRGWSRRSRLNLLAIRGLLILLRYVHVNLLLLQELVESVFELKDEIRLERLPLAWLCSAADCPRIFSDRLSMTAALSGPEALGASSRC